MRPIRLSTPAAGASAPIPLDINLKPFSVTVTCIPTGGASVTLQYTTDNVFAANYNPAAGNWLARADMTAQTTSKDVVFTAPVTAVRQVVAGTGSSELHVVQSGN
jgi:hypothetical protein